MKRSTVGLSKVTHDISIQTPFVPEPQRINVENYKQAKQEHKPFSPKISGLTYLFPYFY